MPGLLGTGGTVLSKQTPCCIAPRASFSVGSNEDECPPHKTGLFLAPLELTFWLAGERMHKQTR